MVSICGPVWVRPVSDRLAALPAPSVMVAAVEVDRGHRQVGGVLPGPNRVAEGQRVGAGAARIGRGAAVVERQRRRAARDRHRLAHVERQRDGLAGVEIAARRRLRHRRYVGDRGVDLRAGLGQAGERQAGGVAGAVSDGCRVEVDRGHRQGGGVLPGRDRVAEGQRHGAGAAGIGRGAAIVERQRRRAARHRHRLAQVERQRDRLAGVEVAARGAIPPTTDDRRRVVSICGPVWVRPVSDRLAALPAPSVMVAAVEIDRGCLQGRSVLPGADRVAEGQRIGARAAGIGRGAAIVERQRRRAARNRHRLAHVERQRDRLAGVEVAARRRLRKRRDRRRRGVDLRAGLGQAGAATGWRHCRRRR